MEYNKYIKINEVFFRPSEVELLVADSSKIKKKLDGKQKLISIS